MRRKEGKKQEISSESEESEVRLALRGTRGKIEEFHFGRSMEKVTAQDTQLSPNVHASICMYVCTYRYIVCYKYKDIQ
jgi:hypothetical protein